MIMTIVISAGVGMVVSFTYAFILRLQELRAMLGFHLQNISFHDTLRPVDLW